MAEIIFSGDDVALLSEGEIVRSTKGFKGGLVKSRIAFKILYYLVPGETWVLSNGGWSNYQWEPVEGIVCVGKDFWLAHPWCLWKEHRGGKRFPHTQYLTLSDEGEVLEVDNAAVERYLSGQPEEISVLQICSVVGAEIQSLDSTETQAISTQDEDEMDGPMAEALRKAGLF